MMNKNDIKTMFSSESNEWATPMDFYNKLNNLYGPYNLDPCSTPQNAKCQYHFTVEDDGLTQDWSGRNVFMNPPYGKEIGKWIAKAYEESRKQNTTVTCLIPSRTDTKYWHDYCMKADKVLFVKGRLKFGSAKNAAPFPSAVIIFTGKNTTRPFLNSIPMIGWL
jgi:phage N-6-adenine-methyltransferase